MSSVKKFFGGDQKKAEKKAAQQAAFTAQRDALRADQANAREARAGLRDRRGSAQVSSLGSSSGTLATGTGELGGVGGFTEVDPSSLLGDLQPDTEGTVFSNLNPV
jgi:hypothetical protein